jgi:hypothetical protein
MDLFQTELFDNSKEKLAALDELFLRSLNYRTSQDYYNLLNFINRFPKLSPYNAFLIHTQNNGVKVVLSASQWAKYGYTINYQARPLVILVPFGPVSFVYDIADTSASSIPDELLNPFITKGIFNNQIYNLTLTNCAKESIQILEKNIHKSSAGFANNKKGSFSITLNNSYSINEKYSTLIHELAHIFCGHLGINDSSWWKSRRTLNAQAVEIEAESISFLVCKRFGLQTSSEAYLSNYIENHREIPPISFDTILTVSGYIEQMGTSIFKPKQKKKQD